MHRRRRGYPIAVLIGLVGKIAYIWHVFTESVKEGEVIQAKSYYNFYESIVDTLRPNLKLGLKTILVATPIEKEYKSFINHIMKHQSWMIKGYDLNTVTFDYISLEAIDLLSVQELVRTKDFRNKLTEVSSSDIQQVMDHLEKLLNDQNAIETLLFNLNEVEDAVYGDALVEYILITESLNRRFGKRTSRLLQIAGNKNIKTRIIEKRSLAKERIDQLGGLVCILKE